MEQSIAADSVAGGDTESQPFASPSTMRFHGPHLVGADQSRLGNPLAHQPFALAPTHN